MTETLFTLERHRQRQAALFIPMISSTCNEDHIPPKLPRSLQNLLENG